MLKELTLKDVAQKLYEEGMFEAFVKDDIADPWRERKITGVDFNQEGFFTIGNVWTYCAIEVEQEYEPYPDDEIPPVKGKWLLNKTTGVCALVTAVSTHKSIVFDKVSRFDKVSMLGKTFSNTELFENWTYEDGTPVGKIKGE